MAEGVHGMPAAAGKKGGFLQGILQVIPLLGTKKEEADYPARGPVPVHNPSAYASEKSWTEQSRIGWYPHRIKYRGVFDLDGLYKTMALWFKEKRFELHERLFKSKPPELEVRWEAERKRTNYARELVFVHMHMWGDYDVEVIKNGQKKRMVNVRMIITITGDIEAPYSDIFGRPRWNASNIERRLHALMFKWVMYRELTGLYWDQLYYELYSLNNRIKEFLKFGAR
ncbi:hypothetical protein HYV83_03705 [Candidatus Woesearchaeota archaeon]|nr:hypothetical protein [Candidatus Woesearchaeota archaeon]